MRPTLVERLASHTERTETCWNWTACRDRWGYGIIKVDGKNHKAHRISYEIHVGPIPRPLVLDHLCANTSCVNPDHLEPVTNFENLRRAAERRTECQRGHPWNDANTAFDSEKAA